MKSIQMENWTNEFTLKFLKYYRRETVLWDPAHAQHKDKRKVNDAWVRISGILDRSVIELKRKKDSLMATFRGHARKRKASIKSGASADDLYKPIWFAYDVMAAFLAPIYDCTPTQNTQDMVECCDVKLENDQNQDMMTEDSTSTPVRRNSTPSLAVEVETNRHHPNVPELQEAGSQIKEAFNMLHNFISIKSNDPQEDECDLFARILAKKLRKIPEQERELVMYEIDGMLLNRKYANTPATSSGFIDHSCSPPTPSPNHSESSSSREKHVPNML